MKRIAVHCHVFYPEMWPELRNCIRNFPQDRSDVFITFPDLLDSSLADAFASDFPNAKVWRIENRGYDIGPFFFVLGQIDLDDYDFVVKLHTKRNRVGFVNYLPLFGAQWRRKLLAFCATPHMAERCLETFAAEPTVGMIGHGELVTNSSDEMDRSRPSGDETYDFVAGTMFIARADALRRLAAEVSWNDFPPMRGRETGLAHSVERRFGQETQAAGFSVRGLPKRGVAFRILFPIARRLYAALFRR